MARQPARPRDPNQLGKLLVNIGFSEAEGHVPTPEDEGKDPAAVALGREGGGARAKNMPPERRAEIARNAAEKGVAEIAVRTYRSVPGLLFLARPAFSCEATSSN